MGTLTQANGQNSFKYNDEWVLRADATPLSLSMPLRSGIYKAKVVNSYLWGLLPDNEEVLERWGKEYKASPRNPFGLLRAVGRDVAGAVSFVEPDRIHEMWEVSGATPMSEAEVGQRLTEMRLNPTAWTLRGDRGQFSLAGAQSKIALRRNPDGSWSHPFGSEPTTHIIKPAMPGLESQEINEHLSLSTARRLGLSASVSEVHDFGDQRAVVVERYDRIVDSDGSIFRVHQEDFCQSLGVLPEFKYEEDGGPSASTVISHLRGHSSSAEEDIESFVRALAYNVAIGGTDAHAKNYSMLLSGPQVTLAPLYDISSFLPYAEYGPDKLPVEIPMRIGGERRIRNIQRRHWEKLARAAGLNEAEVVGWARETITNTPDALQEIVTGEAGLYGNATIPSRMLEAVEKNVSRITGDDFWPNTPRPAPFNAYREAAASGESGQVWVEGYVRRDGKSVEGYYRSRPTR